MKKRGRIKKLTILISLLFLVLGCGCASAAWTEQWHFDVASFDYSQFQSHYTSWGRIHYHSEIMAICANTIDNGIGPAGKPILEVYIAGGMSHEESQNPSLYVPGSLYCLNGATGEVIWHIQDPDCIYVQTKMELADVNDDGELELYVTDFHGSMLRDAQTGALIWKVTSENRRDKQTAIIRDPADGIVYVYDREMYGYMYKRIAATGVWTGIKTATTGYPCFGGSAVGDMNNDEVPEIVEGSGGTYCFDLDLNVIWQDTTVMGGNTGAVPVLADVNNDGWLDIIVMSASSMNCRIGVLDGQASWDNRFGVGNGNAVWLKPMTYTGHSGHNAPAVYDIDGDGFLEAGFGWVNDDTSPGCIWQLTTMQEEPWSPDLDDGYSCTFANAWGEASHLEILTGNLSHVWDHTGVLVSSKDRYGSSPILVADMDGDGMNEALSDGSNIFPVASDPFNNGGTVWSWGWNICWDTGVPALNIRQEVLSQLYNTRRTGAELPLCPYWWTDTQSPPTPTITVISPNGYENWQRGRQYPITWTSSNVTGTVDIELYKGTTLAATIETNTTNDGNTTWIIPSTIPLGTEYRVRIKNSDGTIFDFSDNYFNIVESLKLPIFGPSWGLINRNYTFCTNTTKPDPETIYSQWDWGDGTNSGWLGPYLTGEIICVSHNWTQKGTYDIRVKLKDIYGQETNWSDPHRIMMYELKKTIMFGRYTNATEENGFITIEAARLWTIQSRPLKSNLHTAPEKITFSEDYKGLIMKQFIIGAFEVLV